MSSEKLQKVLAAQGLGSRRGMEQWITEGRVRVNGKMAKLGDRVSHQDSIAVDGQPLARSDQFEKIKFLQYNKPEGEICSRDDPLGRPTIFDNLPDIETGRWLSIGRLDLNTSGLLLFTNNGEVANKLMHPSTGLVRRYMARVRGKLTDDELKLIVGKGVEIDGKPAKFHDVVVVEKETGGANHWLEVGIEEGRNREVRKIFETLGHPVSRLKRIAYGTVGLMPNLRKGHSKEMAPLQIEKLLKEYGMDEYVEKVRQKTSAGKVSKTEARQGNNMRGSELAEARSSRDKLKFKAEREKQKERRKQLKNGRSMSSGKPTKSSKPKRTSKPKRR